ncbi:hypothetical protein RvY_11727 [Ramazzottius varieornatus]|uniref:Uncharacterized protein n=1 Tax=Ramazzottius varieornatus TaxID=947166 RepID=A0A1D1VH16_RAMVA|nr:hypothetical protein RvY_11727 [Ramazzottius varieornatus]
MAVVSALRNLSTPHNGVMELIRQMHSIAARTNFNLRIKYIAGLDSSIADSVPRCNWKQFRSLHPTALEEPVKVDCDLEFLKRALQSDHVPRSEDSTVFRDGSQIDPCSVHPKSIQCWTTKLLVFLLEILRRLHSFN